MLKKFLIFILICPSQYLFLYPQTPSYYHYTVSDGMSSSTVFDAVQDKEGYIWFATLNGMSRFDGKRFTTYNTNDGLNSSVITNLQLGDNGEIYIANYENGINVLKNGIIKNYRSKFGGDNFNISYLLKSGKNLYSYISYGAILVTDLKADSNKPDEIISPHGQFLLRLAKLPNNKLVALTSEGIFYIRDKKLFKADINGLPNSPAYCLATRSDGSYFIGTRGGLYQIKNNYVVKQYKIKPYGNKLFYQIYCDKNDNIWFSVLGNGLFLIPANSNKIINVGKKMGLENTQIDSFLEDGEGNIWITTFGKGVYCLNNLYIHNYSEKDGLNNDNITCITKGEFGRLLIGTINGINILYNDVIEKLKDNSGKVLSGYINGIKSTGDYIYVCWAPETPEINNISYKGMKFRFLIYPSFSKTEGGQYLIGNMGNAVSIQKKFNYIQPGSSWLKLFGDSIRQNRVNVIMEDTRNNIWAGTNMGLCKLTMTIGKSAKARWKKTFFPSSPVLSSKINWIYQDNNHNVWFTGLKGIARYNLDDNTITSYTSILEHDLSTPTSLVSDNKNRIWFGSMRGLYLVDGNSIKLLNSQTGLPSDEVLSLYYDNGKNQLYAGTSEGISVIDVGLFDSYKYHPPNVKVNSIKAGDSVYKYYSNLIFEPTQNNVYIKFTGLNYSSPLTLLYMYILNNDSTETRNDFLEFSSLKSGTYNLRIFAKSQNTSWGKPFLLTFTIKPRFTETLWFNTGVIFLLVSVFFSLVMWRMNLKNKKIQEQLELTEKINGLKHEALSAMMNPHFIFNSLNSVQYLVNSKMYEEANDYIAMMAKLMRTNLDSAGSAFILLSEEINRLKLYLDLEKLRFQESFSYDIITGASVDVFSIMIPNMIIQPFVENTLWHGIINSGSKGIVTISFSFEDVDIDAIIYRSLIIKVTDNGIGITEAKKNKKEDHISKGIQIIEDRLKLLSAKMKLPQPIMFEDLSSRDNNSHGTEVIVSLPPPLYKIIDPDSNTPSSFTD